MTHRMLLVISLLLSTFITLIHPSLAFLLSRAVSTPKQLQQDDGVLRFFHSYYETRAIITSTSSSSIHTVRLHEMKRPLLDQIASTLFQLETNRVNASSVIDEKGRYGEPMEWSEENSLANRFSKFIANNPIGYQLKQFIANIIAGNNYNQIETQQYIQDLIKTNEVLMFSFTSCPFCRKAKDLLDERNIQYSVIELDLLPSNQGNEIRAELGKLTKRTSVPNIFIQQRSIGGCNDGTPGLLSLIKSGTLDNMNLPLSSSSKN